MANQLLTKKLVKVTYDYSARDSSNALNSTVAAHGTGVYIPTGAVITNAFYNVRTTFTSGGGDAASIAIAIEGAGDLKAGIAISAAGDVWDAGIHGCLPGSYAEATVAGDTAVLDAARKAASYILTTAQREITFTVGAAQALTAGVLDLYVEYVS